MSPRALAEPIAPGLSPWRLTGLPTTAARRPDVVTLLGGNSDRGCLLMRLAL